MTLHLSLEDTLRAFEEMWRDIKDVLESYEDEVQKKDLLRDQAEVLQLCKEIREVFNPDVDWDKIDGKILRVLQLDKKWDGDSGPWLFKIWEDYSANRWYGMQSQFFKVVVGIALCPDEGEEFGRWEKRTTILDSNASDKLIDSDYSINAGEIGRLRIIDTICNKNTIAHSWVVSVTRFLPATDKE